MQCAVLQLLSFSPWQEHTSLDSDTDVLSDITVSSVHTSDLSSFEEESEEEPVISDSTEEGEITSDGKPIKLLIAVVKLQEIICNSFVI